MYDDIDFLKKKLNISNFDFQEFSPLQHEEKNQEEVAVADRSDKSYEKSAKMEMLDNTLKEKKKEKSNFQIEKNTNSAYNKNQEKMSNMVENSDKMPSAIPVENRKKITIEEEIKETNPVYLDMLFNSICRSK